MVSLISAVHLIRVTLNYYFQEAIQDIVHRKGDAKKNETSPINEGSQKQQKDDDKEEDPSKIFLSCH